MISARAFFDELEKIAVQLNRDEQHRQALQYAALGTVSGPVVGAVGNLIQHGKLGPTSGTPLKRWIPAMMATGTLVGGVLPVIRQHLTGRIQAQARERQAGGG